MAETDNITEVLEDMACVKERMNESHMSLGDSFVCEVAVANLIVESREIMTQVAMCEIGRVLIHETNSVDNVLNSFLLKDASGT